MYTFSLDLLFMVNLLGLGFDDEYLKSTSPFFFLLLENLRDSQMINLTNSSNSKMKATQILWLKWCLYFLKILRGFLMSQPKLRKTFQIYKLKTILIILLLLFLMNILEEYTYFLLPVKKKKFGAEIIRILILRRWMLMFTS